MAGLLARLDPGAALAMAGRVRDEAVRAEALAQVAGETQADDVIGAALDAARALDPDESAPALATLAAKLGDQDLLDEALDCQGTEWFWNDPRRGYVLNPDVDSEVPEMLAILAAGVNPYEAVELGAALGASMGTKVTITAAKHLAHTDPDDAVDLASELDPGGRAVALAAIGRITGSISLVDSALDVARESSVESRAGALAAVAAAWATVEPDGDAAPLLWLAERWQSEPLDDQ